MTKHCMTKHRGGALLCGLVLGLVLAANPARAEDCRERLLGNSYACQFKFQVVTTTNGSDRIVIEVPFDTDIGFADFTDDDNPGNAFVATLTIASNIRTTYCSCKSQGSLDKPKFGTASKDFFCVTGRSADVGVMFEGQVNGGGGTIKQGQLWFADPFFDPIPGNGQFRRGVFTCESN